MIGVPFDARDTVRVGFIGVGGRGRGLLRQVLACENVQVIALCDMKPENLERARERVEQAGQETAPALISGGETAFEELCRRDDIDIVYIASPWDWHAPMAVCAMENGKHAAVEVPACVTLDECWQLVDTSERTRRHCVILENCCYEYAELLVLNLIREGLLGELTHGAAAYNHDLRETLFADRGEGEWRRFPHIERNGNLYPTHGLGPVANYMDINRGDRFEYLVSVSSRSASLDSFREKHVPQDNPKWRETYRCGDQNVSILRTAKGRVVTLEHNVVTPQPYDRINLIAGTNGIFRDFPPRLYIDGQEGGEAWASLDAYKEKYEHDLWRNVGELARKLGGHGGMDFIMNYRLMQCLREGLVPDIDVYDAATWSAPGPLSDASVASGSAPVPFPDFTRGRWQEKRASIP